MEAPWRGPAPAGGSAAPAVDGGGSGGGAIMVAEGGFELLELSGVAMARDAERVLAFEGAGPRAGPQPALPVAPAGVAPATRAAPGVCGGGGRRARPGPGVDDPDPGAL